MQKTKANTAQLSDRNNSLHTHRYMQKKQRQTLHNYHSIRGSVRPAYAGFTPVKFSLVTGKNKSCWYCVLAKKKKTNLQDLSILFSFSCSLTVSVWTPLIHRYNLCISVPIPKQYHQRNDAVSRWPSKAKGGARPASQFVCFIA